MVSHRPGWRGAPIRFASSGARESSVSTLVAEAPSFRPSSVHPRACRVYGYGGTFQVEELDRRERSPDLLEAAAEVGPIEQVDERAFEPGDGDVQTGSIAHLDAEPLLVRPHELARKRDRSEPEGPRGRTTADTWMDWQQTVCAPMMRPVFWGLARTPEAERGHEPSTPASSAATRCGECSTGISRIASSWPATPSPWATSPSARRPIGGSTWWRSARRCRTWRRGTGASPSARHSART